MIYSYPDFSLNTIFYSRPTCLINIYCQFCFSSVLQVLNKSQQKQTNKHISWYFKASGTRFRPASFVDLLPFYLYVITDSEPISFQFACFTDPWISPDQKRISRMYKFLCVSALHSCHIITDILTVVIRVTFQAEKNKFIRDICEL